MSNKKTILNYLINNHTGAENAVLGGKLCASIGVTGRLLRNVINDLRTEGHPVCSDTNGYFYAASTEEISHTISHLVSRAKEMDIARKGLEKARSKFIPVEQAGGERAS